MPQSKKFSEEPMPTEQAREAEEKKKSPSAKANGRGRGGKQDDRQGPPAPRGRRRPIAPKVGQDAGFVATAMAEYRGDTAEMAMATEEEKAARKAATKQAVMSAPGKAMAAAMGAVKGRQAAGKADDGEKPKASGKTAAKAKAKARPANRGAADRLMQEAARMMERDSGRDLDLDY